MTRIGKIFLLVFLLSQLPAGEGNVAKYARAATDLLTCFTAEEQSGFVQTFGIKRTPVTGISLAALNDEQQAAFRDLLKSVLRKQGLKKLEPLLVEANTNSSYKISFFGNPGVDSLWAWRLAGLHLDLYFSVNDSGYLSATPSYWTEQKGISAPDTKPLLYYEQAYAFELLKSLESYKKYLAVMSPLIPAAVTAQSTKVPQTGGLPLKEMNWDQMILFIKLINAHLGNFNREIARRYWDQIIDHDFKQLRFYWYGSQAPGQPYAYIIQGPAILIFCHNSHDQTSVYLNSLE